MNQWKIDMFKHCHLFCFLLASVCLHLTARAQVLPLTAEMRAMIGKSYKIVEQKIEDADPDDEHAAKAIVVPDLKGWRFDVRQFKDNSAAVTQCTVIAEVTDFYKNWPPPFDPAIDIDRRMKYGVRCMSAHKQGLKIFIIVKWPHHKKYAIITDVLNVDKQYYFFTSTLIKKDKYIKNNLKEDIFDAEWGPYDFPENPFTLLNPKLVCNSDINYVSAHGKKRNNIFLAYDFYTGKFIHARTKHSNHLFIAKIDKEIFCPENP